MEWEADLDEARRRLAALDKTRAVASARATAASSHAVDPFGAPFLPLPPVTRPRFWAQPDGLQTPDTRLELDAHGRPVAQLVDAGAHWERAHRVWEWDGDGSFFELELDAVSGPSVHRARVRDGRIVHVATAVSDVVYRVQLVTWQAGRAVRADEASPWGHGGTRVVARVAEHTADGTLEWLRAADAHDPGGLHAGLALAATLTAERVEWDGRVARPEPWPSDDDALVEPLALALDTALREAVAQAPVEQPFVLEVLPRSDYRQPGFPPVARLVSARWRDQVRAGTSEDHAAIANLQDAVRAGDAVELNLIDRLGEDALRACRALSTAFDASRSQTLDDPADQVADALGERLAELLHAHPLTADPLLALVEIQGRHGDMIGLARARRTAGGDRVARFLASIASTVPRPDPPAALRDRTALEALLRERGLASAAHRLAHEVAAEGLLLVEHPGARSRLGAPPLLPRGAGWPVGFDDRALTFLGGLDLSELAASPLPAGGWLLFFADPGDEDEDGLIDQAGNEPGSVARVLFTDDPVEASGPALGERRVAAQPYLTLPSAWGAGAALGLDADDAETFEAVARELLDQVPGSQGGHWVGGHAGAEPGDGDDTILLLHLQDDSELGFSFLDAGTIQFRIPPSALAARDWSRIVALATSS